MNNSKNPVVKYLIRTVKSFVFFNIVFLAILSVLILITPEYSFDMMFSNVGGVLREGSWPKVMALFFVVALLYPKLTYVKKETIIYGDFEANRKIILDAFSSRGYELINEDSERLSFRLSSVFNRLMRMFEDEISITKGESVLILQGSRKEILRISGTITFLSKKENADSSDSESAEETNE